MSKMRYGDKTGRWGTLQTSDGKWIPNDNVTLYATVDATEPLWCNDCDAPAALACANAGHGIDASNGTLWAEST